MRKTANKHKFLKREKAWAAAKGHPAHHSCAKERRLGSSCLFSQLYIPLGLLLFTPDTQRVGQ